MSFTVSGGDECLDLIRLALPSRASPEIPELDIDGIDLIVLQIGGFREPGFAKANP